MGVRRDLVREAEQRARRQGDDAIRELRLARLTAGLSQATVARAIGVARQLVSQWERQVLLPDQIQLARWGAAVGRDVTLRVYLGGSPLRDAGHVRLLERTRRLFGRQWRWRTEVAASSDPLDRRAVDAVIQRGEARIGLEIITRLIDAQAQVRGATLKQESARLPIYLLVLTASRHNRQAVRMAAPTLSPVFPLTTRDLLRQLRAGASPSSSGILFV